ncbi:MAG: glutamine synthetase family protein [Acutalibacteraceae bacterium]
MGYTVKEVLQFIEENDVKFIKLVFFDTFGIKKNISIVSDEIQSAFEHGVYLNGFPIEGFGQNSNLLLFPDPNTLKVLPWRPQQGRVVRFICDIKTMDGKPFEGDVRGVLKDAIYKAANMGYKSYVGLSCQFYLFKADDDGRATHIPYDTAGYLDVAPLDKGENVRRQICLMLEQMEMQPRSSHHEGGPGQNQIDCKYADALTAADNFVLFKTVVKTVAAHCGLFASFMPKPLADQCGNNMKINISLIKNNFNVFRNEDNETSKDAKAFIAGVLEHLPEMMPFFNSMPNSYARFADGVISKRLSWANDAPYQLVSLNVADTHRARVQLNSPDPSCNPYLAFALMIYAGLDGIQRELTLKDSNEEVPISLAVAVEKSKNSAFLKSVLPPLIYQSYIDGKGDLIHRFDQSAELRHKIEEHYFELL